MRPASLLAALLALCGSAPASAFDPFSLESADGAHRLRVALGSRLRMECWDAHAPDTDCFQAARTRASLRYEWGERAWALVEFQDVRLSGLDSDASGSGALYRSEAGSSSHARHDVVRQLWLEIAPTDALRVRVGRQDLALGKEVGYTEPDWAYLESKRLGERLLGTVGWTHAERSNDGISATYRLEPLRVAAFAAKPTTGVFDVDSAYAGQPDIRLAGGTLVLERGAWLEHTDLRAFAIAYEDERRIPIPGLASPRADLDVQTLGLSLLGVYPLGPGRADLLLFGALQRGDWFGLDHRAFAALAEVGYRLPDAPLSPWLRAGVNAGSGDGSASDGDHESFFNLLPTNHLYYGYADRLALANLIDLFMQLRLTPAAPLGLELFVHHFQLLTDDDGRHFGSGAYDTASFGYGIEPQTSAGGHRGLGTELDLVASWQVLPHIAVETGWSYLFGHGIHSGRGDDDVRFTYLQLTVRYP
jgi:hypothetical protein